MRFFDAPDTVHRAREAFDQAGFTLEALTERLGANAYGHLSVGEIAPLERATRAGDRLDLLLRLFVIGLPVPRAGAEMALDPLPLDSWTAGGVVAIDADEVRGMVAIRPQGEPERWLVAHDLPRLGGNLAPDHVLGVSASTLALAGATIRRHIAAAFDLGTGCGIQALHASAHSTKVIASDLNPRAVACASLTMELNRVGNVEVREGNRFAPVAGETFDLVVANPPFVVSPSERYLFRDSPLPGDEICRSIVRELPNHLNPGGHAQLLASWARVEGEDWRERLRGWFDGTGCDALVMQRESLDPLAHAASWLRQTEPPDAWQPEYDEWLSYFERLRIVGVDFGLITMRRRGSGEPWFRAEEAHQDFAMPCGDQLGAVFELADFLAAHPGPELLSMPLQVRQDVVLDERARPTPDGWSVTDRLLRQTAGLRHEGQVDPAVASIVAACDGRRPLAAIIDEAATAAGVEPSTLAAAGLPILRRLVELGFLLPATA